MFTVDQILSSDEIDRIGRAYMGRVEGLIEIPLSSVVHFIRMQDGYSMFRLDDAYYITSDSLNTIPDESEFDMQDAVIRAVKVPLV